VGEDKAALTAARQVAELRPDFLRNALLWAAAAAAAGEYDEANNATKHCERLMPHLRVSMISPGVMSRFIRQEHHHRLQAMLRRAGMRE
jgi:hypothetical protein